MSKFVPDISKKCECYREYDKWFYTYNPSTGAPIKHTKNVGVCWGTKEQDECSCGGDTKKCDFYPEKREG